MYLNNCFSVFCYSIPWKCTIKFFMVILPGAPKARGPPSLDTRTPARYATGWISYFDLRLRSGRLPFPDCKATHAASLKPIISSWSPWQTSRT